MNINELFEILQDDISDELSGEITLHKSTIIWSYTLEDIDDDNSIDDEEDDDFFFGFESTSNEEKLIETYTQDLEIIQMCIFEYNEEDNWNFSDYKTKQNSITFKIL